jgi:hypothetical protein
MRPSILDQSLWSRSTGVPLLEIVLRRMIASGIVDIHVALRYEATLIERFLEEVGPTLGKARISTFVEEEPLGTIGAAYRTPRCGSVDRHHKRRPALGDRYRRSDFQP